MIETIAPAVCGTRHRTALALPLSPPARSASPPRVGPRARRLGSSAARCPLAIALAVRRRACARPALVPACRVPQWRRQVPERWHHELPLPLWSLGYGAGLGVGVLTYQPVATFLVVGRRRRRLRPAGRPCWRCRRFGAGRALGGGAAAERSSTGWRRCYRPVRRVNAVALALLALALVAAPGAAPRARLGPGSQLDPSVADDGTLAYTQRAADGTTAVVVRRPAAPPITLPGRARSRRSTGRATSPTATAGGITVVRWRTACGSRAARRRAGRSRRIELAVPRRRAHARRARTRLIGIDLRTGRQRVARRAHAPATTSGARRSTAARVWHKTTPTSSRLLTGERPQRPRETCRAVADGCC